MDTTAQRIADKDLVWGWYLWWMAMVRAAQPNASHRALARLTIVTQNVDDLHERAGSTAVTHVHEELLPCAASLVHGRRDGRRDQSGGNRADDELRY